MASVASQLIEEVTAHAQSDSFEDARELCADCIYFPNNLRKFLIISNSVLLTMRNYLDKSLRENQNKILCSITFLGNYCNLLDNVEKYVRT